VPLPDSGCCKSPLGRCRASQGSSEIGMDLGTSAGTLRGQQLPAAQLSQKRRLCNGVPAILTSAFPAVQLPDVPWGIISIKAQDEDYETPMQVGRSTLN
jgi:hypothetical protein